ncbi:MAG TPA: MopE-related protein [Myxococcota bacterium]|nr:MopE-related protein [Myxococcota bacterium]
MFGTTIGLLALLACNPDNKDLDDDGFLGAEDCDDDDAAVNPDAAEVCDGVDNDCDGGIDNGATDAATWYADADGDGHGGTLTLLGCEQPARYLETSDDCDDLDATVSPSGSEICDGIDNDCDELIDGDDDSVDLTSAGTWYADIDDDGYGTDDNSSVSCDQPAGYVALGGDCNDDNSNINPATEWHEDLDGDGYGSSYYYLEACEPPGSGYVHDGRDCDDLDETVNPDGLEVCDDSDNDCDGLWNDDDDSVDVTTMSDWFVDGDGDGYGDEDAAPVTQCAQPSASVADNSDCDDTEAGMNPGEAEVCNDGVDNDCSGDASECGLGESDLGDADVSGVGEATSDYYGRDVAVLDFDGDGANDVFAGAHGNDENASSAGRVYITYGPMTNLDAVSADVTFSGDSSSDYAGWRVESAGDVDDDGADDALVGGYYAGYGYGAVWLAYGGTTSGDLDDLAAVWEGESYLDYLGHGIAGIGDLNADGFDDIAFSAPRDDTDATNGGVVFVVYGSASALSGTQDLGDADLSIWGQTSQGDLGYEMGIGGGDLDGDGASDLAISEGSSSVDPGTLYLFYGSASASIISPDDADAFFEGQEYSFGRNAQLSYDFDDDGYNDLAAADRYRSSYRGAIYVYQGSASGFSGSYGSSDAFADFGGDSTYDYLGYDVSAGDLDGDGVTDLAAGAYGVDDSSDYSLGAVYVFSGPFSGGSVLAADADASVLGDESYGYFGTDAAVGDLDGDGTDDLLSGARGIDGSKGAVYVFYGGGI